MSRSSQGHEYQITIFSPEGKLYQVEYAFRAIKTSGLTSVGVRGVDTVCLVTEKRVPDKLIDEKSVTNLFNVSEKVGALTTGIAADAKTLIQRLRYEAGDFRLNNGEGGYYCPVDILCQRQADLQQLYTQRAFMRPFGVETILCSIDEEKGPMLYKIDPSGHFCGYKAVASGVKEQEAINYLEKQFKKREDEMKVLSEEETIILAVQTLQNVAAIPTIPLGALPRLQGHRHRGRHRDQERPQLPQTRRGPDRRIFECDCQQGLIRLEEIKYFMNYDKVDEEDLPLPLPLPSRPPAPLASFSLLNLCVLGILLFALSIYVMRSFAIAEKNTRTTPPQHHLQLTHNSSHPTLLSCPPSYSFSPLLLQCLECYKYCNTCQPGLLKLKPCVICDQQHSLYSTICVRDCPSGFLPSQGLCLISDADSYIVKTTPVYFLPVYATLSYIVFRHDRDDYTNLIVMIPPLGETHMYYASQSDLNKLADANQAKVLSLQTPLEQVLKMDGDNQNEFVGKVLKDIIGKYTKMGGGRVEFVSSGDGQMLARLFVEHMYECIHL